MALLAACMHAEFMGCIYRGGVLTMSLVGCSNEHGEQGQESFTDRLTCTEDIDQSRPTKVS